MTGRDASDGLATLLRGCLDLWEIDGRVQPLPDGACLIHTAAGRITVTHDGGNPGDAGAAPAAWRIEAPATDAEPSMSWSHASVLPVLRSLRLLLAPDLPRARLIVARAPESSG